MTNDISRQKIEEELTLQRELKFANVARVSSIRELSYMLSHEISQPLMIISAYVSGCIRRLEENVYDKNQIIATLKAVNHQVDRAGTLTHRMTSYVDNIKLDYEKINIHHVIESAVSIIAYEFPDFPVAIQYDWAENLPLIEIDEAQIKLVILYLLKNGIEEMSVAKTKQPQLVIETTQINEFTISVCVKDKGRGISSELHNKLFNACHTTKPNNIGMGLATCRSIIEAHKGDITAQSLPEGGACFKFTLPIGYIIETLQF
jgi:two-component system, LuxR family, sensor histidine kinase DctS